MVSDFGVEEEEDEEEEKKWRPKDTQQQQNLPPKTFWYQKYGRRIFDGMVQ
jgi:hypothetical protein